MAFSGSSYFAGIGTACTVIAFALACGTMVTTSSVQPPNRLERLNGGTPDPSRSVPIGAASSSTTSPGPEQSSAEKPSTQDGPSAAVAAAPSAPAADPKPAPPPQPAAPATERTANVQDKSPSESAGANSAPRPVAGNDNAAPAKGERTTVGRAGDRNREASRKRSADRKSSDDRKFSEQRRRHEDERQLDEAANAARQMPRDRDRGYDRIVEQDDMPRYRMRPRPFDLFEDDGPPRVINESPPRFGFFGDN